MTGLWIAAVAAAFAVGWVWRGAIAQRLIDEALAGWREALAARITMLDDLEASTAALTDALDRLEARRGKLRP